MSDAYLDLNISQEAKPILEALARDVSEMDSIKTDMNTQVANLQNYWNSLAADNFFQNYETLKNSIQKTLEVVDEVVQSNLRYMDDVAAVNEAYSQPHVM